MKQPIYWAKSAIKQYAETHNIKKCNMAGMFKHLSDLADKIDDLYPEFAHLTYDAEYHGWSGEALCDMRYVEKEVLDRLGELYYICCKATGNNDEAKYEPDSTDE